MPRFSMTGLLLFLSFRSSFGLIPRRPSQRLSVWRPVAVAVLVVVIATTRGLHFVHHGTEDLAAHALERLLRVLHGRVGCLVRVHDQDGTVSVGSQYRGIRYRVDGRGVEDDV